VRKPSPQRGNGQCRFCEIVAGEAEASIVFEDEQSMAFLDSRPLFPGHCLLIPKAHYETLSDLPEELVSVLFLNVRRLAGVVQDAMNAEGTFVAINNIVSQSVPHFHVHIVPRRRKDGLRGFFWPRGKYENAEEQKAVRNALMSRLDQHAYAKGQPKGLKL
jgi:histidine triad (HIT) family protein